MGTKRTRTSSQNENASKLSVPPGFASLTSFRLRKINGSQKMDSTFNDIDAESLKRSFSYHPWMLDCQNNKSEDVVMDLPSVTSFPEMVAHGCPECSNCPKEPAQWRPEDARKDALEEVPVFYPTEQEFNDTLNYIASIRSKVEEYGMCRIVPPPTWDPPCLIQKMNIWETSSLATQIQQIHGHFNHHVHDIEGLEYENGPDFALKIFQKYADAFKSRYFTPRSKVVGSDVGPTVDQERWEPPLDVIEGEYRRILENPTEEIEVLHSSDLNSGVFGSGFPTKSHFLEGSHSGDDYLNSGWNLNNTPRVSGSLLCFESFKTSDILNPRLRIGMCFSSFGWKVEDHHLYLLSYVHLDDPKIWYSVPGRCNVKFQAIMKKHLPDLFAEQPKLQDRLVSKLSSSTLKSENIPVYRCVQHPREFVLVLPGTYYAGFDTGFNCTEAVNVAPVDWLPHGQHIVELYCERGIKTSVSHDKLLLGAAREAIRAHWEILLLKKNSPNNIRWKSICGKDGILAKALKSRIELESNRRKYLCICSQSQRMDQKFDSVVKRECSVCFYDLHLSAAACRSCSDRYTCLNHSKQLCSCAWSEKIFLFRYEISELKTLLEAIEGKIGAVYKSAREVLKLSLFSSGPEDGSQISLWKGHSGSHGKESEDKQHGSQQEATPKPLFSTVKDKVRAKMRALLQTQKSSTPKSTAANDPVLISSETSSENGT